MRSNSFACAERACFALCLTAFAAGGGWAASTPIYKCFDKHLALVYTDQPCKDGEQLDIRAGDPDPAAVARLERERDALDRSADQRLADLRRSAAALESMSWPPYESVDGQAPYQPAYAAGYDFLPYPSTHRHPKRLRLSKVDRMHRFAPPPPYRVPRH